jgi:hypothetical protein
MDDRVPIVARKTMEVIREMTQVSEHDFAGTASTSLRSCTGCELRDVVRLTRNSLYNSGCGHLNARTMKRRRFIQALATVPATRLIAQQPAPAPPAATVAPAAGEFAESASARRAGHEKSDDRAQCRGSRAYGGPRYGPCDACEGAGRSGRGVLSRTHAPSAQLRHREFERRPRPLPARSVLHHDYRSGSRSLSAWRQSRARPDWRRIDSTLSQSEDERERLHPRLCA